ncbi:WASH complex subunit 5-like [Symsagittifera roscoffensis]|uniref:WASH complex subunit 5-like n=1 Tax=Symsagittifera roscoffensis TaxID=84072 RepID=UPI00307C22D4
MADNQGDFLSEENLCGQTILKLVSRGNAIIAEILRLSDFIPPVFNGQGDHEKYAPLLMDFHYFTISESFEKSYSGNGKLVDLNEEFRDNHKLIIERFYLVFESVYKYVDDLNKYVTQLSEGSFVQETADSVIKTIEGKQLLAEAVYIYGVMLLLLDIKVPGDVREKMLVFYYRNGGTHVSTDSHIDEVCKLLASTGYIHSSSVDKQSVRPQDYPESLFRRVPLNDYFLQIVCGRMESDDLYNLISFYPNPTHRSHALSGQASMIYVMLYFVPELLHSDSAKMRGIVDKFFPDNWIINLYMTIPVNLAEAWEPYKAARLALAQSLMLENVKRLSLKMHKKMGECGVSVNNFLKEGVLTVNYLLDNRDKLLNCIRESNTTLKWMLLHNSKMAQATNRMKQYKTVQETISTHSHFTHEAVLELLMNSAQLELKVKRMFKQLLAEKISHWTRLRSECEGRMDELSDVFSGVKPLTRVDKNEHLTGWFKQVKSQIAALNHEEWVAAGRNIQQLSQALEEVQEFHQLESNLYVKQFLNDTRQQLAQMLRIINVKQDYLSAVESIMDLSYAWGTLMHQYIPSMQTLIKRDPSSVIKLKAVFLKMSTALLVPLIRITQAKSSDRMSVSQYYSNELVMFMRAVLQIIPTSMFALLAKIIRLQTNYPSLRELPTKVEKEKLTEYALETQRFEVARLTHDASVLAQGVLMMKNTMVGVIKIDPRQLLEDGIRKELVVQVANALHSTLVFNPKAKVSELNTKLPELAQKIDGFRRSFEYIQDYVNLYGLKIWQEEYTRVMHYNVERECNVFLRVKISDQDSQFQSSTIPIPKYPPTDQDSVTFVGRLGREMLRVTDFSSTVYIEQSGAWFDLKSREPVMDTVLLQKVVDGIGPIGLALIDRFFSFMLQKRLERASNFIQDKVISQQLVVEHLTATIKGLSGIKGVSQGSKDQPSKMLLAAFNKLRNFIQPLLTVLSRMGQIQQLRMHLNQKLSLLSSSRSQYLHSCLLTLNKAILHDIEAHTLNPKHKPYPSEDPLLVDLSEYLNHSGLSDPLSKVYILTPDPSMKFVPVITTLLVIGHLNRASAPFARNMATFINPSPSSSSAVGVPADYADTRMLLLGVHTFLKQFHNQVLLEVFSYMGSYVTSLVSLLPSGDPSKPLSELPSDLSQVLHFMRQLALISDSNDTLLSNYIPAHILELPLHM